MPDALLIQNGVSCIDGVEGRYDLAIGSDGRICSIAVGGSLPKDAYASVVDASGCFMVPGGIDAHVHLDYSMGDTVTCDDFYTGTKAALAGGTTTIIDFCEPQPGESVDETIEKRMLQAKRSAADYALHFIFTENYRAELRQIESIKAAGIGSYKLYTTYPNTTLHYNDIEYIFRTVGKGGSFLVHAEDNDRIEELRAQLDADGYTRMDGLYRTRPNEVEEKSVRELSALRRRYEVKLCIAHVSSRETLNIKRDVDPGLRIETCPHYMAFTKDRYLAPDGALYSMNPPLKSDDDIAALWDGALNGAVDMLSTDHCPFTKAQKLAVQDYKTVPCGLAGIQSRIQFLLSEGMERRGLSLARFIELTSENAAKFYGLYPRKGCLRVGSDGDVVLLDKAHAHTYSKTEFAGAEDYNVFEGWRFSGGIERVFLRGRDVYSKGNARAERGFGTYIRAD